jgi:hypothetical protein
MLKTFINIFRVPELRNKVLFTLMMLAIYRIGYHVPIPGVNQEGLAQVAEKQSQGGSAAGRLASYVSLFSGGSLSQSTIFGLGVMPYISASIIFQLLATVVPSLEKLQKEGETGRKKIQEWTRYATVPLCIVQGIFWLQYMHSTTPPLVQKSFLTNHSLMFWTMGVLSLTANSVLRLGDGSSTLNFAKSASLWSAGTIITINEWSGLAAGGGADRVFFGTDATGLGANLAAIRFLNPEGFAPGVYTADILSTGEIVAIPEPGSMALLIGGLGFLASARRRGRNE